MRSVSFLVLAAAMLSALPCEARVHHRAHHVSSESQVARSLVSILESETLPAVLARYPELARAGERVFADARYQETEESRYEEEEIGESSEDAELDDAEFEEANTGSVVRSSTSATPVSHVSSQEFRKELFGALTTHDLAVSAHDTAAQAAAKVVASTRAVLTKFHVSAADMEHRLTAYLQAKKRHNAKVAAPAAATASTNDAEWESDEAESDDAGTTPAANAPAQKSIGQRIKGAAQSAASTAAAVILAPVYLPMAYIAVCFIELMDPNPQNKPDFC